MAERARRGVGQEGGGLGAMPYAPWQMAVGSANKQTPRPRIRFWSSGVHTEAVFIKTIAYAYVIAF